MRAVISADAVPRRVSLAVSSSGRALACVLLAGALAKASAQENCEGLEDWLAESDAIARRHAPMLWFGPNELYFPTLPFHTAFDGIDNEAIGTPGLVDFEDPGEIAALNAAGQPSWNILNADYVNGAGEPFDRADRAAIFYRVQRLSVGEVDHLWRFLFSDEQAWSRIQSFQADPALIATLRADTTQFLSIDYHAYFLRDLGLVGHNWDTEYMQLLIPAHPGLADLFRVWIGAGHTERITNNVLVLSGEFASRQLDAPPSIIVELGDHSTSPDVSPYGEFRPGLDVNWHTYKLWGIRDTQAQSGQGALGPYQLWMTYPRNLLHSGVLVPGTANLDNLLPTLAVEPHGDSGQEGDHEHIATYALVPGDAFVCLSSELNRNAPDITQVERWIGVIRRAIEETEPDWAFTGFEGLSDEQKRDAIEAMRRWFWGLSVDLGDRRHRVKPEETLIWMSKHYVSPPSAAYKQHLYRPTVGSLQRFSHYVDLFRLWFTWNAGSSLWIQTGFVIPAFWLPTRLPGYLALQLGTYTACSDVVDTCADRWTFAGSLLHTGHFYALLSWYGRISWIPGRDRVHQEEKADWLIGGGLALTVRPFRLRLGLTTDLRKSGIIPGATTWEVMISNL